MVHMPICRRSIDSRRSSFGRPAATSQFAIVKRLSKDERKAVGEDIAYVQFKWPIGKPRIDHLRSAVWEVRTNLGTRIARTLFAVDGAQMILLHDFIKKTQRTPNDDIELAEKRFKEWQHGEK